MNNINDITTNTFWRDFIQSLLLLQQSNCFKDKELPLSTPLWYKNQVKLQIKPQWQKKGIMVLGNLLDKSFNILPLEKESYMGSI